jgi:ADP-heptose:LPS heptosyltransferase
LVNPEWAPVLDENADVDEIVIFPRNEFHGVQGWARLPRWAAQLRASASSELVLDFQGLLRSALLGRLCRRGRLVGLSDAREGARYFYDHAVATTDSMHAVDRYLALVRALGIAADAPLSWKLPRGVQPQGFDGNQPFVLLHPFARGPGKSLGNVEVQRFCQALGDVRVVIAGRRGEALPPIDNAIDLVNQTTLLQLVWLIRHAQFVVSVDSGPMHIAAAITARLVAIHSWSDPCKVGPSRDDAVVWQRGMLTSVAELRNASPGRPAADLEDVASYVAGELRKAPRGG